MGEADPEPEVAPLAEVVGVRADVAEVDPEALRDALADAEAPADCDAVGLPVAVTEPEAVEVPPDGGDDVARSAC